MSYKFLLQKETFYKANRWFLVAGIAIALGLPLVYFTKTIIIYVPEQNFITENYSAKELLQPFNYTSIIISLLWIIYGTGVLVSFIKLGIEIFSLKKLINKGNSTKYQHITYVKVNTNVSPFSFLNYLVYNPEHFSEKELQIIFKHEITHIQQRHSLDVLGAHLLTIVFWFHPLVWLYKKEIANNLEYIADEATLKEVDKKSYINVLFNTHQQQFNTALSTNFFNSLIKKRIVMLHQKKSNSKKSWKYAIVIPAMVGFVLFFQVKTYAQYQTKKSNENTNTTISIRANESVKDTIFVVNGKASASSTPVKLSVNGKNQSNAVIEVKGYTTQKEPLYIVNGKIEKDAKVANEIPPSKITSVNILKDKTATSLYGEKGKDGVIIITTNDGIKDATKQLEKSVNSNNTPLYIINGKPEKDANAIKNIQTDEITSVNVLKDKAATSLYGEAGKKGVIIVTTKVNGSALPQVSVNSTPTTDLIGVPANTQSKPRVVVDGKMQDADFDGNTIDPQTIKEINVLKGDNATKKYGEKGNNGVIEIILKKGN
ncbi:M56 family metallopeptidase [Zhouia sp. PK063]|uniref:M56 family metallopeptidase n=1 Tax=Zhouia sp. PK063 TaxID=3373602 RepID=UPI00378A147C